MHSDTPATSMNTITAIVLKEIRIDYGLSVAKAAEECKTNPSSLSKLESGKKTCSIPDLYLACRAYDVETIDVMTLIEDYADYLYNEGWDVCDGTADDCDLLLERAQEYYKIAPSFRERKRKPLSIFDSRFNSRRRTTEIIEVVKFAVDNGFYTAIKENPNRLDSGSDDYREWRNQIRKNVLSKRLPSAPLNT